MHALLVQPWIVDFAADCGMKYVNLTTRHHDSFCLWDTRETTFNVVNTRNQYVSMIGGFLWRLTEPALKRLEFRC